MQNKNSGEITQLTAKSRTMKNKFRHSGKASRQFLARLAGKINRIEEINRKIQDRLDSEINELLDSMDKKAEEYLGFSS